MWYAVKACMLHLLHLSCMCKWPQIYLFTNKPCYVTVYRKTTMFCIMHMWADLNTQSMHLSTCLLRLHTFISLQTTSVPLSVSVFISLSFFSLPDCGLEGSRIFRIFIFHLPVVCPCQPACVWLLTLALTHTHTHTHTHTLRHGLLFPLLLQKGKPTPHIFLHRKNSQSQP